MLQRKIDRGGVGRAGAVGGEGWSGRGNGRSKGPEVQSCPVRLCEERQGARGLARSEQGTE